MSTTDSANKKEQERKHWGVRSLVIAFTLVSLTFMVGVVLIAVSVAGSEGTATVVEVIRDLFVILLALEALLIGAAFTVLIIQIARFANLLQNELRPILESSAEAVNTVRGTAAFLSQNVVEPVMKINEFMAGAQQALRLMRDLQSLRDIVMAAIVMQMGQTDPDDESPERPTSNDD